MARSWSVVEGGYRLDDWGGRRWTLRVDGPRPGLVAEGSDLAILALDGLAESGRRSSRALAGSTLLRVERRHGRVEATYAPLGWGGLRVRAAWGLVGEAGVELEVQVTARSVGRLRGLEVVVLSEWRDGGGPRWVQPRDARSAGLGYDGRESTVADLTTYPPGDLGSTLGGGPEGWFYAQHVGAGDASRVIREGPTPHVGPRSRTHLFGHDLERGVVLRGRVRGHWLSGNRPRAEALELDAAFRAEPPPLGT